MIGLRPCFFDFSSFLRPCASQPSRPSVNSTLLCKSIMWFPKWYPKWFPSDRVIRSSDRTDREFGYGRSSSDGGRRDDSNSATDRSRGRDLVLVFVLVNTRFKSTYSLKNTAPLTFKRSFRTHARRPGRADSESERHTTKHSFFTI